LIDFDTEIDFRQQKAWICINKILHRGLPMTARKNSNKKPGIQVLNQPGGNNEV
jgi:hypothetical protein